MLNKKGYQDQKGGDGLTVGYVGIDLGGTNIKLGIVDQEGNLLAETEKPTNSEEGAQSTIQRLCMHVREIVKDTTLSWDQIQGIGLGLPGFLDLKEGLVIHLTNLHWDHVPIREWIEQELNKPVRINNDGNVAALGESWTGAGKGVDDLVCVTLGTGVGGGIIANGQLISGARGFAAEIGHILIESNGHKCNCGNRGCLETIASATGITKRIEEAIAAGESTQLSRVTSLMPHHVFAAAREGDTLAKRVLERAIDSLAIAFAQLSVILNPQLFVVGGGIAQAGDDLFLPLREAYTRHAQKIAAEQVRIIPAALGNRAGILGAAGLFALDS